MREQGMTARMRRKFQAWYEGIESQDSPRVLDAIAAARQGYDEQFDASISSGGTTATLCGTGFVLCLRVAELNNFGKVIATSGGFTPGAILAAGVETKTMLHKIIHTDFGSLLTPKTGLLHRLWALLRIQRYDLTLPAKGVYSSKSLQNYIDAVLGKAWPEKFMTVATTKDRRQVVFANDGVHKYNDDGSRETLANAPPNLGAAAAATSAVPGIIDAMPLHNELLFDGVLSGDGPVQIEPIARHFGKSGNRVIAFDVGEDGIKNSKLLRFLWMVFSLGNGGALENPHPTDSEDVILVKCSMTGFHGLKFTLDLGDKWRAIIGGYLATVKRLRRAGLISADTHPQVYELAQEFRHALIDEVSLPQAAERLLGERGLW